MVNITSKSMTLRRALAEATLHVSSPQTMEAIVQRKVPKGDVFEFSRAAGLLAIKKTSEVIPDCHPLPIEYASITYQVKDLSIIISVEVHTIYKTGVEVEAMHGASITALTMYDMLKPLDKGIQISNIKLVEKQGGKSGFSKTGGAGLSAAVIVCSDTAANDNSKDLSGPILMDHLRAYGVTLGAYNILPDDLEIIRETTQNLQQENYDLILLSGGTGLSPKDVTPEAIAPLITREIPGIMETARAYGQQRIPYAMLSRGIAGFMQETLIITLPGSPHAVEEYVQVLFPYVFHLFSVKNGSKHTE
jgi:cyclic pyranopterin monophosphate synthase